MEHRFAIVDFYVDEPSCLGVPPYVSPYVRYSAGALVRGGISQEEISYATVDDWRRWNHTLPWEPELLILIAGTTVPGRYLGGKIGSFAEIIQFLEFRKNKQPGSLTLIGGPIRHSTPRSLSKIQDSGGIVIQGDVELYAHRLASHPGGIRRGAIDLGLVDEHGTVLDAQHSESMDQTKLNQFAPSGAFVTTLHPGFPHLMMELETYRGCTRSVHCSFCTEALYGSVSFRPIESIEEEVKELSRMGNRYFRLGRQADLLTYLPGKKILRGFPEPDVDSIQKLYEAIRRSAPELQVLHLDNINPGGIANHPKSSKLALQTIARLNTTGDTAAMGMETTEERSISLNRLKANKEEVLLAVRMVNEAGGFQKEGQFALLPGLNFLQGLPGETEHTFENIYSFLKQILSEGLLLRRINIRRVHSYFGTSLEQQKLGDQATGKKKHSKLENRFKHYKELIRKEVDRPMLQKIYPPGTPMKNVFCESSFNGYILGRQLGSYPVTLKFPPGDLQAEKSLQSGRPITAVITGAEERSLHALSVPIRINELPTIALKHFPGMGKKRIGKLVEERPLRSMTELTAILEGKPFCSEEFIVFHHEL